MLGNQILSRKPGLVFFLPGIFNTKTMNHVFAGLSAALLLGVVLFECLVNLHCAFSSWD